MANASELNHRAKTHLRVAGFQGAVWKGFVRLEDAKAWVMESTPIPDVRWVSKLPPVQYDLDIDPQGEISVPLEDGQKYYAVAYGRDTGVYLTFL